ncbi:MAG: hypothetical protein HQ534_05790 [Armatimonadetes bacterium]|nr:hypothetical protein [Armatimonadota bacterium]
MSSKQKSNGRLSLGNLILIILAIINITLYLIVQRKELNDYISDIEYRTGIPLLLIIKLGLLALCVYWAFYFLIKIYKNIKKPDLSQPARVYQTSTFPKLPPENDTKKIIKFIIKEKTINKEKLINKFGYSETKAEQYIELLASAFYIELYPPIIPFANDKLFSISSNGRQYAIDNNLD